ncbi:MAG: tyrosine-type recombinase/integrase [bacterium]
MESIHSLIQEFLDYLVIERNRSPKTRENYRRCLERFVSITKISFSKDITEGTVRAFRIKMSERTPSLSKRTQAYYVIVIRSFLKYLAKRGIRTMAAEKIDLPKLPERHISIIEYNDLERLLDAPKGTDIRTFRDKAILETLFSTGLRISELCALDRYTNLDRNEISIRGKGGVIRVIFFSERAKTAIKNYLDKRVDMEEAMFISLSKGNKPKVIGRIIPRAIQRLVTHYARAAGIPDHVTPHQLRHQFATDLLMNGADLRSVQELLGHANIATTQVYTHLTNKHLKEVHQTFHRKKGGI